MVNNRKSHSSRVSLTLHRNSFMELINSRAILQRLKSFSCVQTIHISSLVIYLSYKLVCLSDSNTPHMPLVNAHAQELDYCELSLHAAHTHTLNLGSCLAEAESGPNMSSPPQARRRRSSMEHHSFTRERLYTPRASMSWRRY